MGYIEIEEGEAFILQEDDDENIDPDRDFSYIDKKIENVLGHYQKDFMGGAFAENLGARYGGYGSFLPMQQRSPSVLSDPRTQSHVSSKSPQNLPSEQSHPNPTGAANNSIPVKPASGSSANRTQALSEAGMLPMNNQLKLQDASECASNKQQKEPLIHLSKQKSLKFRVKLTAENVLPYDKSAIYSGLGLDISPSSSPEDSPSDSDSASLGMQVKTESPSCIIKIMTTLPLPNCELLSPLHDSLVHLTGKDNSVEPAIPDCAKALLANSSHGNYCSEGKREASSIRKSKVKNSSKERKLNKKELRKERTLKEEDQNVKHVGLVTENYDYPALSVNGKEGSEILGAEVTNISMAAVGGVDTHSEEMELASVTDKNSGFKPSIMYDKKSKVRCSEEDIGNSTQQMRVGREKVNGVSASASSYDAAVENVDTLRGKAGVNTNVISSLRGEFSSDKRNEVECREDETNKFWKQQNSAKDKVKDGVLNSLCPKQDKVCRKEYEMVEAASKYDVEEAGFFSMNDVEGNDKHDGTYEEMRDCDVETLKLPKQKTNVKATPRSQLAVGVPSGKDHTSSMPKKKSWENRTDGRFAEDPPRGSLVAGSSAAENEVAKGSIPSKSRKGESDLQKEMKKDDKVANNLGPNKKGKDVSLKESEMGVPEREIHIFPSKQKEKSSSKKNEIASNVESNIAGGMIGGNSVTENVSVVHLLPAEIVPHDDWVQCDKCHKWRLLPLGMDPESLPKVWKCSMLTWLPGKNKCSVSEEETNAVYQPPVSTQVQNNQQAYLDVGAFVGAPGGIQHVGMSGQTSNIDAIAAGSKRRNLLKTDLDAARRSGFQEHIPVKKDQRNFSEYNSRNQKKLPRDSNVVRKSGDRKPSKFESKREADFEVSGVPKKMKRVHQQSIGNPDPAGLLTVEVKGENENNVPGALEITQDFGKRTSKSSLVKVKDRHRTQNAMIAKNSELKDSGKKRKLKDQGENITSLEYHPGRVQHQMKNSVSGKNNALEPREERKERKSKASNFQGREGSADKRNSRANSGGGKHNLGSSGDNSRHKRGRRDIIPLEENHADRASQRITNVRNSTEKAFDFGLSDYATTSSSSKVSCKGKGKASEVKCSPIGSISSSPFGLSKCDSDRGTNKMPVSFKESDDLFSSKQLKSRAEGAFHELAAHSEEIRDRRSNLSRTSGADAAVENNFMRNKSAGKHPGPHITDTQINLEDCKDASYKLDRMIEDSGTLTSQRNLVSGDQVAKSSYRLRVDETNSRRMKAHDPQIGSEKEPSCHSYGIPETEEANGSYATSADNVQFKLSGEVGDGHVSLRHTHPTGQLSDIESSVKKGSSHRAAKTALKEATNLKHSANRLKISGSTNESTEVFFQAALKFLHGASLLEPGNNESGRCGEMASTEVYSTTAALCELRHASLTVHVQFKDLVPLEGRSKMIKITSINQRGFESFVGYCAHEYERGNNLASAALAYKCMEVAYMRVVYCNDLTATRDRMELQIAVRAAPQVESPSSSASDVDNLNNQAATDTIKDGHSVVDHRAHVISAGKRPSFLRLLNFTEDINRAMEASRRSQSAFTAANPALVQAGKHAGISSIKTVLDFSFHDVEEFLHLVRLAMEALSSN